MKDYQRDFIKFVIEHNVLTFGEFILKSGRVSPYFFNTGMFQTGKTLAKLGEYYASTIVDKALEYDILFGPAYKGIPLVASTACALHHFYQKDIPYSFNRKETKDHGEGGQIVGCPLTGQVLIIDDVITAGTAIRHSVHLIEANQAHLKAVVVALDRQEVGPDSELSAIQQMEQNFHIRIYSIVTLENIIDYLKDVGGYEKEIQDILNYRSLYGAGKSQEHQS
jgi:orotate phosphoribosyltransferase